MEIDNLYNQDCLVGMREIPTESIDLVVTDCPYHVSGGGCSDTDRQPSGIFEKRKSTKHINFGGVFDDTIGYVRAGKLFKHNDIAFSEWLPDVYRVLKQQTHCYIMVNARNLKNLQTEAENAGFTFQNLLVWKKDNCTPNKYYMNQLEFILLLSKRPAREINDMGCSTLLSVPNILGTKKHPTEKPVALMEHMIRQSSNEGDIVLDPFAGSGSTLVAARNLNRHYLGYEIDDKYYNIAKQQLTMPKQQLLF
jgi:site-specific DNA-methyltransferase (adenine-specific)